MWEAQSWHTGETVASFGLSVGSRQDSGLSPRAGPAEQGTGHRGTQPDCSSRARPQWRSNRAKAASETSSQTSPHSPCPSRFSCRWETRQFYYQPDPRLASHVSIIILHICPWQLYILAPSDANPVSLFSCLIPRQYVPLSSLCSQLSFGYLILTAPNKLVIFLKGDTL